MLHHFGVLCVVRRLAHAHTHIEHTEYIFFVCQKLLVSRRGKQADNGALLAENAVAATERQKILCAPVEHKRRQK